MKNVKYIIFRYLTNAEFFNIYKPTGTEIRGGGQGYIDFPIKSVPFKQWEKFFDKTKATVSARASGPSWNLPINNIGLKESQNLTIYQRRIQSISIAAQKITSRESNRLYAWHPDNGFPHPADPKNRKSVPPGLTIYIIRSSNDEFWAGWFRDQIPCNDKATLELLKQLKNNSGEGYSGFLEFPDDVLFFDETSISNTFYTNPTLGSVPRILAPGIPIPKPTLPRPKSQYSVKRLRTEEQITQILFEDDLDSSTPQPIKLKEVVQKIKIRNTKAVRNLKELYQGQCQISGEPYCFIKKDGSRYCEAHHLIPLGDEGADSPHNIIIVSPLIHRMLHYADVSPIDLSLIKKDHTLDIKINGTPYSIKWHPKHADCVIKATK